MAECNVLPLANEIAAGLETQPMLALGIALLGEREFIRAAIRAKQLLASRAARVGLFTNEDYRAMYQKG